MKEFKGNNGKWEVGKEEMTVISDSRNNIPTDTGHDDIQYYGGYLIAESIYNKEDAKLIAAAPEMLKALLETDKDLCVLEGNMAQIEKTDPRAEGMTALVTGWRTRNKEVINKALGL